VDSSLPGLSGVELIKRARALAHRRSVPVIMFSADDIERDAASWCRWLSHEARCAQPIADSNHEIT